MLKSQCFLHSITPNETRGALAATTLGPGVQNWQGFLVEMWITAILVITIFGSTNSARKGNVYMATIPIGFAIALGIMTGVSMEICASYFCIVPWFDLLFCVACVQVHFDIRTRIF